jgi:hypothetical protein
LSRSFMIPQGLPGPLFVWHVSSTSQCMPVPHSSAPISQGSPGFLGRVQLPLLPTPFEH